MNSLAEVGAQVLITTPSYFWAGTVTRTSPDSITLSDAWLVWETGPASNLRTWNWKYAEYVHEVEIMTTKVLAVLPKWVSDVNGKPPIGRGTAPKW